MAMSFSRPDPSSPASVADASFSTGRRGFDQNEVRDFLRMVAAELGRLQERERFLERELRSAHVSPDLASVQLDDHALTRLLGEETARVLTTARESAVEIRQKAEQSAAQMLSEASDEAARVREEAEIEAARRRADAGADAEAELSMAKQQGREMVNEARAYRERVLSELARRRELAREQIEQLLHGRDRLMQSFERARLVAVDVIGELQPLGEPDEYVNLSPTTGPVPVMLPNAPRPESQTDPIDADAGAPGGDADPDDHVATTSGEEADTEPSNATGDADDPGEVQDVDEAADVVAITDAAAETDGDADVVADIDATTELSVVADVDSDTEAADTGERGPDDTGERGEVAAAGADAADTVDLADDADAGSVEPPRDDVVVDLFARLRAGTETPEASADEVHAADADSTTPGDADQADDPAADAADSAAEIPVEDADDAEPSGAVDDEPNAFERRDGDLTPLVVSSARRIKRVLADEQNEVLDALRRKEPVRTLDALLPSADVHRKRYRAAIVDDLLVAANAGGTAAGRSTHLRKADAAKAVTAADAVLDEWVTEPLRERLERCIADGDGDNVGITKRVRALYREWKTQHIDDQLDDVLRAAYGRGAYAAIEAGTAVTWVVDARYPSCADCDDNTLAGEVSAGDEFPTGHVYAPAHVGCRCLLLPADR